MRKQEDFLKVHLGMWVPHLPQDVEKNAETEFYRHLAMATQFFLEKDMLDVQSAELALNSGFPGEDNLE